MNNVKWIYVFLFIFLVSFVDKNNIFSGHDVGDKAPQFTLPANGDEGQTFSLQHLSGEYVLLSFWASYDAASREQNVRLSRAVAKMPQQVRMVSVSFDVYHSVFQETVKSDGINPMFSYVDLAGEKSAVFKLYRLKHGFKNYLLNPQGVIIAKDVQADELAGYIERETGS